MLLFKHPMIFNYISLHLSFILPILFSFTNPADTLQRLETERLEVHLFVSPIPTFLFESLVPSFCLPRVLVVALFIMFHNSC